MSHNHQQVQRDSEQGGNRRNLMRYAAFSVGVAIFTILLKFIAFMLTGSVGLLSDAMEGLVNLAGAIGALIALWFAAKPPDDMHTYGHDKAEYFSSGAEGSLIFIAAAGIMITGINRLINPQPLEQVNVGLVITLVAGGINLFAARLLIRVGSAHQSIALEADGKHLMTDVWTSVGVVIGVGAAVITGYEWLDPIIALLVGVNILREGYSLVRRSASGLLDTALSDDQVQPMGDILANYERQYGLVTHQVRTRQAGARGFVDMHVLVPGDWTVQHGHDMIEALERDIKNALPSVTVITHLEPLEDPVSYQHKPR